MPRLRHSLATGGSPRDSFSPTPTGDRPTDRSFVIIWCSPSSSSTSISGTRPTQCCPTFVVLLLYGSIGLDETIAPRPRICDYTLLNINIGEAIAALWYLKNEISSKIYICSDLLTPDCDKNRPRYFCTWRKLRMTSFFAAEKRCPCKTGSTISVKSGESERGICPSVIKIR